MKRSTWEAFQVAEVQLRSVRVSLERIEMRAKGLESKEREVNAEDDKGYTLRHTSSLHQCGPLLNDRREKKRRGGKDMLNWTGFANGSLEYGQLL